MKFSKILSGLEATEAKIIETGDSARELRNVFYRLSFKIVHMERLIPDVIAGVVSVLIIALPAYALFTALPALVLNGAITATLQLFLCFSASIAIILAAFYAIFFPLSFLLKLLIFRPLIRRRIRGLRRALTGHDEIYRTFLLHFGQEGT